MDHGRRTDSRIAARRHIRCVRNELPSLFEEVQVKDGLDKAYAQISSKKLNVHSKFFFLDARIRSAKSTTSGTTARLRSRCGDLLAAFAQSTRFYPLIVPAFRWNHTLYASLFQLWITNSPQLWHITQGDFIQSPPIYFVSWCEHIAPTLHHRLVHLILVPLLS